MVIFLTLGVYSLNVSSIFPLQSDYIPLINIYFLLGVWFVFMSLCWFGVAEYLKGRAKLPIVLSFIISFLCLESLMKKKSNAKSEIEIFENVSSARKPTTFLNPCSKCETCEICIKQKKIEKQQADATREKIKNLKALNLIMFSFILLAQFISFTCIWILISKS